MIILLTKTVDMTITSRNANHYKEKGYDIPMKYSQSLHKQVIDVGAIITVRVEDLSKTSKVKVQRKCDNCGKIQEVLYKDWKRQTLPELGDLCKDCAIKIKYPHAMKEKYGEVNPALVDVCKEKRKQTCLEKYGVEYAIASDKVKEKIIDSYINKFGVDNPMKNKDVVAKAIQTNNDKYGGNSALCDKAIREKSKQTCLCKYGVSNPYQSKEIQAKAKKTLYKNSTNPTSKVEKILCKQLIEIFGADKCFPSYPVGELTLDCLLILNDNKIDIEYDGYYWHKNRGQKDGARNAVLMDKGYRIIRIKGNNQDALPSNEQIINAVDYLVKDNHHLVFIDMNNKKDI